MWLINTETLLLEEFQKCPTGTYAILSHRWEEEELNFDEFRAGQSHDKKGYRKVLKCCEQARAQELDYAWVDTCCIDKRSSAELSEAINSMFRWYAEARECYVYMSDVSSSSDHIGTNAPKDGDHRLRGGQGGQHDPLNFTTEHSQWDFMKSQWFTRGWTLQELLAPPEVYFFDHEWECLGNTRGLVKDINATTGIDSDILLKRRPLREFSIAQRMSWAASRVTTRTEDIAYCLLGIFDVNMPLLYGEAEKAFSRLQEIILETSDDESIFAWTGVDDRGSGLLAPAPKAFALSRHIVCSRSRTGRPPYAFTNKGLAISSTLVPFEMNTYACSLQCKMDCPRAKGAEFSIGIYLCRTDNDDQYRRVRCAQQYDLCFLADASTDRAESDAHQASLKTCSDFCPNIFQGTVATGSRNTLLYVPQRYVEAVQPRGIVSIELDHQWTFCPQGDMYSTYDRFDDEGLVYDTHRDFRGPLSMKKNLTYGPNQIDEGVEVDMYDHSLRIEKVRIGFDINHDPVCQLIMKRGKAKPWMSSYRDLSDWRSEFSARNFSKLCRSSDVQTLLGDRLHGLDTYCLDTTCHPGSGQCLHITMKCSDQERPSWRLSIMEEVPTDAKGFVASHRQRRRQEREGNRKNLASLIYAPPYYGPGPARSGPPAPEIRYGLEPHYQQAKHICDVRGTTLEKPTTKQNISSEDSTVLGST